MPRLHLFKFKTSMKRRSSQKRTITFKIKKKNHLDRIKHELHKNATYQNDLENIAIMKASIRKIQNIFERIPIPNTFQTVYLENLKNKYNEALTKIKMFDSTLSIDDMNIKYDSKNRVKKYKKHIRRCKTIIKDLDYFEDYNTFYLQTNLSQHKKNKQFGVYSALALSKKSKSFRSLLLPRSYNKKH